MPERTRKVYQDHYEEKLSKRNQKIRTLEPVTIRRIEEQQMEQESPWEQEQKEQEDQENEGSQKLNPQDFLTQEDTGPQETYKLEVLGAEEPITLEIDTMNILEQLGQQTGPPTVHLRKTNISMELAGKENLAKQGKLLKEQVPQHYIPYFVKFIPTNYPNALLCFLLFDFTPFLTFFIYMCITFHIHPYFRLHMLVSLSMCSTYIPHAPPTFHVLCSTLPCAFTFLTILPRSLCHLICFTALLHYDSDPSQPCI